jgi:hypothetical protein
MRGRCDCEALRKHWLLPRCFVGMLVVMAVCQIVKSAPAEAQQSVGAASIVVNNVTGTVQGRQPILLRDGEDVYQSERIDTAARSSSLLAFRDNTQLAICPFANVQIQSVAPTRSQLVIYIASGCIRFSSGEVLKAAYINTPSAQIRTYGTIVIVTVSARGATTVSVAEGVAAVTGAGRTVTVAAGRSTLVLPGAPPTPPVPTPPLPVIVTDMDSLLAAASVRDFGTRAAARSPEVEAPYGANMISPNISGKIQSEIAGDATPACATGAAAASMGTHAVAGAAAGSKGTHAAAGSKGTHGAIGLPAPAGCEGTLGGAP